MLEDNDPVIQICIKGRNPTLRHVPRIHRINVDSIYARLREDPDILMRYWPTKYQLANLLTKGTFTKNVWDSLLELLQIREIKREDEGISQADTAQEEDGLSLLAVY